MHTGHRQRMYHKLCNSEGLYDYELLEILLYSACPRINTNPLAHRLIDRFTSLSRVFNADIEELKIVEGVGDSIANFIRTAGAVFERIGSAEGSAQITTFGAWKKFVDMRFRGRTEEYLEIYFASKNGTVNRIFTYTSGDRNKVEADPSEITRNILLAKPNYIMVAHNHLNGRCNPSESDEVFTKALVMICGMHNVRFFDHMIYSDRESVYSYRDEGRLEEIAEKCSFGKVLKWIKNTN